MQLLKQTLFTEYGGFADKRIKDLAKGSIYIVDDRGDRDFGSSGLYGYFCTIYAVVVRAEGVLVRLSGNVPMTESVIQWGKEHDVEVNKRSTEFEVESGSLARLTSLATAIDAIVAPGRRYEVANYKYVCPRTAASLDRLAAVLKRVWPSA